MTAWRNRRVSHPRASSGSPGEKTLARFHQRGCRTPLGPIVAKGSRKNPLVTSLRAKQRAKRRDRQRACAGWWRVAPSSAVPEGVGADREPEIGAAAEGKAPSRRIQIPLSRGHRGRRAYGVWMNRARFPSASSRPPRGPDTIQACIHGRTSNAGPVGLPRYIWCTTLWTTGSVSRLEIRRPHKFLPSKEGPNGKTHRQVMDGGLSASKIPSTTDAWMIFRGPDGTFGMSRVSGGSRGWRA